MQKIIEFYDEAVEKERLTPHQLFEKHSKDLMHIVTDEDLKNLRIGAEAEDERTVSKETDDAMEGLHATNKLPDVYGIASE